MLFNQAKLSASAFAYTYKEYANIIFNNLVKKCKYTSFINVRIQVLFKQAKLSVSSFAYTYKEYAKII